MILVHSGGCVLVVFCWVFLSFFNGYHPYLWSLICLIKWWNSSCGYEWYEWWEGWWCNPLTASFHPFLCASKATASMDSSSFPLKVGIRTGSECSLFWVIYSVSLSLYLCVWFALLLLRLYLFLCFSPLSLILYYLIFQWTANKNWSCPTCPSDS